MVGGVLFTESGNTADNTKEENTMPPIRKQLASHQLNDFSMWDHLVPLIPKDDPLRAECVKRSKSCRLVSGMAVDGEMTDLTGTTSVVGLDGRKHTIDNQELIEASHDHSDVVPKYIPLEAPEIKKHLSDNAKVLDKLEKKYKGKEGFEALNAELRIIRCKERSLQNGIGFEKAPGVMLTLGKDGIQKMQDVLYDIDPEDKNGDDPTAWNYKSREVIEKTMKDFGVTDIQKAHADILEHSAEWQAEFKKPNCDPNKLRVIAKKFDKDMENLGKGITTFERKFHEDAKKPDEQRRIYDITSRSSVMSNDLIYDPAAAKDRGRAINGQAWKTRRRAFRETLQDHLLAADLRKAIKDNPKAAEKSGLKDSAQHLIEGCLNSYYKDDENFKYRRNLFIFSSIMKIMELQKLREEAEAAKGNPFADAIAKICKETLDSPVTAEAIERLNVEENAAAEEKVRNMENKPAADMMKTIQEDISKKSQISKDFEAQKNELADDLAGLLAIKTIADTINARKVGFEEMGIVLNKEEQLDFDRDAADLLKPENIAIYKESIKQRPDFGRMIGEIKTPADLTEMRDLAIGGNANGLMDKMAVHRKAIIAEDTKNAALETMQKKAAINEIGPIGI